MFFFFNDTATTEIYPLSLHAALPIFDHRAMTVTALRPSVRSLTGTRVSEAMTAGVISCPPDTPLRTVARIMAREHVQDRKSTRLNSSHGYTSYAVFCLEKKINNTTPR